MSSLHDINPEDDDFIPPSAAKKLARYNAVADPSLVANPDALIDHGEDDIEDNENARGDAGNDASDDDDDDNSDDDDAERRFESEYANHVSNQSRVLFLRAFVLLFA